MKVLVICSLVALSLRASPATLVVATLYAIWASLRRDDRSVAARTLLIGALVPLCGGFPDLVAGLVFLALLCVDGRNTGARSIKWASPLLILTGTWAATRFAMEFDIAPFAYLVSGRDGPGTAGISSLLRWLRGGGPGYFVAIEDFIRVTLIVSLWASLEGDRGKTFCKGLIVGATLCAFFAIVEGVAPGSVELLRNPSPFWKSINRMASFATDPNALGILAGVLIPLAFVTWSWALPIITILLVGGLYSGSRSFFLIPLVTAMYVVWRAKGLRFACVTGGTVVVLAAILFASSSLLPRPPAGLVRLKESLDPSKFSTTIESRSIFTKLSWHAFEDYPVFGVGLGRFDEYVVPYSHELKLGIGVWRDGATSVYLEVLCELGLLGAVVFALTGLGLRPLPSSSLVYKGVGVAFLIILTIGAHTNVPEGVAVAGLLLAQTVEARRVASRSALLLSLCGSAAIPFAYQARAIYGFYPWEQTGAEFVRWTATESRGALMCANATELRLRNETPYVQDVEVRLSTGTQLRTLQQGENLSLSVPCHEGVASYMLNVSPGFTPSKFGFNGDERLLGVRQLSKLPTP